MLARAAPPLAYHGTPRRVGEAALQVPPPLGAVVERMRVAVPALAPVMLTGLVEPKLKAGGLTAFAGSVVMADVSVTLPVKPPEGVTEIVLLPLLPAATVRLVGEAESAKAGTGAAFTVKLCWTIVAGAYVVLPDCVASIVHSPGVRNVAVVMETVQTLNVVEAKLTARPEVAVATSPSGVPTVWAPGFVKVIVCEV
jgi:hypothetical protein